jgi:N-acylglucosamine-6-phosphate 2-epimerase
MVGQVGSGELPAGAQGTTVPEALARVHKSLVVSCQAPPGNPMRTTSVIARVATAVVAAGASGVRIDTPDHIREVRQAVGSVLIGLWKVGNSGVYITPTVEHARAVVKAGADIVAIDATARPRPDGRTLAEVVTVLHQELGALVLADVSNIEEGIAAAECGADAVATTLVGLAGGTTLGLLTGLLARVDVPVIAEGGITRPEQARAALDCGAWSVVVGKAITSPDWITERFVEGMAATGGASPATDSQPGVSQVGEAVHPAI